MVEILRDAGYHTIHVGKAHWAPTGTPGSNPYNMGFTVNIAGSGNGHPQSYLPEEHFGNLPNEVPTPRCRTCRSITARESI